MIATIFFSREAFAAKRRKVQDDAVVDLIDEVRLSIKEHGVTDELKAAMQEVYTAAYQDEAEGDPGKIPTDDLKKVADLISHTTGESDPTSTALAIANLLINEATIKAARDDEDDLFLEWVTMHDGAVRQTHKDTDGQVRPIGEKFDVDGQAMSMPGDVTAPIEFWINCRCTLRPTLPTEASLQSTETLRDVSKDERDKRSKDGTAMPDGSYPIANCQDLRNAIQAIGRAKDPAKTKAHIKKRKSALGCPDVSIPDSWAGGIQHMSPNTGHTSTSSSYIYPPNITYVPYTTTSGGLLTMTTDTKKPEADLSGFEGMDDEQIAAMEMLVPWHGVLAPEGVASGDRRTFAPDSLTFRDLPLPLTYQKAQSDGHDGSVVVGSIETIERVDGLMLATGWMLSTPEADEVIGLMAHFGKYGVSVDADDVEFDFDDEAESLTFTMARICSASLVSIPAFAEAYVALGPWEEDAALVASGAVFKDLAPGKTEDGPGWLTHPVDTDRLRDYWVRGPGAAKIGWGTPGDFNRCRLNLAKYVKPQYLSGYCANRHYDALGFWPGRPVSGETVPFAEDAKPAAALTLVAAAQPIEAPAEWFQDPHLTKPTHLTVTKEGRVFGHVAQWGTCHIGMRGVCTEPPKADGTYPSFANKQVLLDNGEFVRTGVITLGGKHAPGAMGLRAASRHYEDTTRAVADVAIGDDEHGVWVSGWVRPGTTAEDVVALRASDISGDWRSIDGWAAASELVGVLAVNNGGFNIRVAASNGNMISLVAAGMIDMKDDPQELTDRLAEAIVSAMEKRERKQQERAATVAGLKKKYQTEEE